MKLQSVNGNYVKSVGFFIKKGKRLQKRWYLGTDEAAAIVKAAQLKTAWKTSAHVVKTSKGKIWGSDFNLARVNETPDEIMERLEIAQKDSCEDEITTAQAIAWFYGSKEKRLAMRNQASIEHSTVKGIRHNLQACLEPFARLTRLDDFSAMGCKDIYDYWMATDHKDRKHGRVATVAERTAVNYLETLKSFLRACSLNSDFGYQLPTEIAAWKFSKKMNVVIAPTTDELSLIYKAASSRMKCFILIALNGGQLSNDIGRMTHDDITIDKTHSVLRKVRLKTHKTVIYKGSWVLWKETVEAIKVHGANGSGEDLMFVNKDGNPLYLQKSKSKIDAIGDEFKKLTDRLITEGKKLRADEKGNALVTFSTIRAFGASWITDKAKSEYFTKLYLCHQIGSGATQAYIDVQYAPLQPMLRDLRKTLPFITK